MAHTRSSNVNQCGKSIALVLFCIFNSKSGGEKKLPLESRKVFHYLTKMNEFLMRKILFIYSTNISTDNIANLLKNDGNLFAQTSYSGSRHISAVAIANEFANFARWWFSLSYDKCLYSEMFTTFLNVLLHVTVKKLANILCHLA